ncbi:MULTISPECIES: nucleotidyltransferase family protein [Brevibacterium]|uniref:DNA polymerase subunit beta n=2 Tax=Brevibacterium casei TaxID=33889 RepID=A0A161S8I5_9MICO|nr:nucleotidyltransferase domain-containing protein [Brevibacterium casei]NJE67888.1 DNA polymerase subunit beta [Brevibacterium sp. LS14]KZE21695.1 DNA polymerase subunit beta [Brevibacterium casei]MBE4694367.1 DNA polymerase subunit beta [Brevibacterium casei]MBY3577489.1 DNA polymerase subunit beta [Brevibacterium casei]MCT1447824.1 nucleotidyltransferase domain-containing protein [Brevibacterium casei]
MEPAIRFDEAAIARICAARGVERLRVFGSAVSDRFDPESSDLDFIVDFVPGRDSMFDDYFGLLEDLSALFDREVELVVGRALKNPYFRESALSGAQELYAA